MRGNQGLIPRRRKAFYLPPVVSPEREIFKYGDRTHRLSAKEIRTAVLFYYVFMSTIVKLNNFLKTFNNNKKN